MVTRWRAAAEKAAAPTATVPMPTVPLRQAVPAGRPLSKVAVLNGVDAVVAGDGVI